MRIKAIVISFYFLIFCLPCVCQNISDSTLLFRIETSDGNEYFGKILTRDSIFVRFKTSNIGIISIFRKDIIKIREVKSEEIRAGEVWYENLQATRYFWSPNGYGLQKGEGYYQNLWVMYNQAGIGVTDNFSIGLGLVPLFLFGGGATPVWIIPKFSIPVIKNKWNLGLGALAGTVIGQDSTTFGIAYGVSTFGSRDKNITLGMGFGYAGTGWSKNPVISLSGMVRAGKRFYLMTENYYMRVANNDVFIFMVGGRSIIRKSGLDFGLVMPSFSQMETFVAIPWLGITIPIQSR